jgi:hypothetical protein
VGVRASAKVEDKTDLTHCSGYCYYSSYPGVQHDEVLDEVVQEVLDEAAVADYDLDNLEPPELDDTDVEHVETENHRFQELEVNVELAEDLVVETEGVNLNVKSSISLHCFA